MQIQVKVPYDILRGFLVINVDSLVEIIDKGRIFDEYPYAEEKVRGFYERFMKGEKIQAGWVSDSDFEKAPINKQPR